MRIQYNHITKKDRTLWDEFVTNHQDGTIFQSPDMFDFYQKVKHYTPHIFLVKDEKDNLLGILLAVVIKEYGGWKGKLSSRTIIYGGPLLDENYEERSKVLASLLNKLSETLREKVSLYSIQKFY